MLIRVSNFADDAAKSKTSDEIVGCWLDVDLGEMILHEQSQGPMSRHRGGASLELRGSKAAKARELR